MAGSEADQTPTRFGFLLLNDFSLISMAAAIETLRLANRILDTDAYYWVTISDDGAAVVASDGLSVDAGYSIDDESLLRDVETIIVCGGRRVERFATDRILRWLRHCDRQGLALGSTCTASFVLAKAGLLDGYRCSIHWENYASLTDGFPKVTVSRSVFTIDRKRYTSAGGTTPIDMMISFVRQRFGSEVSGAVAEQFIYERIRDPRDLQKVPLRHLAAGYSRKLITAVELMEANVREPIDQSELADYIGVSQRQLQRLFQKYLLCTPSRYYLQLRLQRARQLLLQTDTGLVEIAAQTGFVSNSHFSKVYREFFGYPPSLERRQANSG